MEFSCKSQNLCPAPVMKKYKTLQHYAYYSLITYYNNRSLQELFPMMIDDQDIHTIFDFEVSVSKIKLIVQKIKQF